MNNQWYWKIPNLILFDNSISDKQKLLFIVISSLCEEKWYCRASNSYFAEKLNCSSTRVSLWIKQLVAKWLIKTVINQQNWNSRTIQLQLKTIQLQLKTSLSRVKDPSLSGVKHNNTSINNTSKEYIRDPELNKLFIDFLNMRLKKEKTISDQAIKTLLTRLETLSKWQDSWKKLIIENSIIGGWKWFFELKNPPQPKPPKQEARSEEKRLAWEYNAK